MTIPIYKLPLCDCADKGSTCLGRQEGKACMVHYNGTRHPVVKVSVLGSYTLTVVTRKEKKMSEPIKTDTTDTAADVAVKETCESCRHLHKLTETCRFNPPAILPPARVGVWPVVHYDDRCSKWAPKYEK